MLNEICFQKGDGVKTLTKAHFYAILSLELFKVPHAAGPTNFIPGGGKRMSGKTKKETHRDQLYLDTRRPRRILEGSFELAMDGMDEDETTLDTARPEGILSCLEREASRSQD
ncbi:MAG: hypothetical protein A2469_03465 [Candidatus Magasanikbacteria bacterium RIFOXYC2_FULL_40_16]|uniref:Uncharacterized protein n=3 Tax=Candidatus Magasanikiibacteriota TaxID=1752731 RepID=A0A1F6NG16_9BACT|nr:MAG: hypothetical protein A2373_00900 [Candidatus Magasanikbacteria bacterium RIFOXYB1_FULL_40_15]OGH86963.1 MAG: hypothetical protein A2301_01500 [Candidatus Magasanikbacteria bacterium RIFOXYB2_FULL_40_13]OGH87739.1 MAG: hypothetical protein A2206_03755 [Candidatus Magasanikbacteria bacterium RIFOXYA1_FULL_40_8]OGH90336.1 MAG: hypothetical protein A2469_03465 [Candidatus Magasanikbacteria bacterium RIFOXYC2_FULL_40_16]